MRPLQHDAAQVRSAVRLPPGDRLWTPMYVMPASVRSSTRLVLSWVRAILVDLWVQADLVALAPHCEKPMLHSTRTAQHGVVRAAQHTNTAHRQSTLRQHSKC